MMPSMKSRPVWQLLMIPIEELKLIWKQYSAFIIQLLMIPIEELKQEKTEEELIVLYLLMIPIEELKPETPELTYSESQSFDDTY